MLSRQKEEPVLVGHPPIITIEKHYTETINFLEQLRPGGPAVLTAIIPDGKTETITTKTDDLVRKFVRERDGKQNLYFSVNPTRRPMSSKTAKTDIAQIEFLLADLDPADSETAEAAKSRYLAALESYPLTATFIIDSGNGIQALWKLNKPIKLNNPVMGIDPKTKKKGPVYDEETEKVIKDVEGRSKRLMEALGSVAGTQNIDRVLRLPGTTNLPNARKLAAGRVACQTRLLKFNEISHPLQAFPVSVESKHDNPDQGDHSQSQSDSIDWTKVEEHAGWLKSVDDLPTDFNPKGRKIVGHVGNIKELNFDLKQSELLEQPYDSWSQVSLALATIFKADGRYTLEKIAAALMCELPCNYHIVIKHPDLKLRRRAVERTLAAAYQPTATTKAKWSARVLDWREVKVNGSPKASLYNVRLGIVAMGIRCRHDLFRDVTTIGFEGDDVVHEIRPILGEVTDAAMMQLRNIFSERWGFDPEDGYIFAAVKTLAFENCFDPILDLLSEAEANWDGVERLDHWVTTYLKAPDTRLNRAIGRKVLIAAVRRPRSPGCKFDNITVLEGEEGTDKSTAINTLCGDAYFSDQSIVGAKDKEVMEQLIGIWMHESADLTGLKKAEVEHVKAFASRKVDRARPAYGRVRANISRRSIDWATTNDEEYLQSQTGNRRFWPIAVGRIDIEALRRDRLQLLGEAATYESRGESIFLEEELWGDAKIEQEKRRVKDPWEDVLASIPTVIEGNAFDLSGRNRKIIHLVDRGNYIEEQVSSFDLLTYVLNIPPGIQDRRHSMKLATVMKTLGWDRPPSQKITVDGQQVRGFIRRVTTEKDDRRDGG